MIKTINLNGSEIKVKELGGDNTEIFNNSSGIVYASKLPNITIGGDEVIAIPAGAIDGLYGTHGTVYLLGTGSIELRGVDHKITKIRGQAMSAGGSSGISESYIDERCDRMLNIAKTYADAKDTEILVSVKEYADSVNAELTGYIGYTESVYGLEADFENNKFTRLAGAVGKTTGADFDSVNAYGGRRRCNVSDDGEVLAYYGDENFKTDGSNGQVMVEQPKFYYRVVPLKTEKIDGTNGYYLRKARYYISDTPKAGFKVHPAFVRNGAEVDKIYLSAFEGCIYDSSAETYLLNDEQIADFDNDMLSSIANAKPCSGQTQALSRANSRKIARRRGRGWELTTIQSLSATQLLFLVEYATFNSQAVIGTGATMNNNDNSLNSSEKTGETEILGNMSGKVTNNNNVEIVAYRGEENFFGNTFQWIDGINVYNQNPWSKDSRSKVYIADNTFSDDFDKFPYSEIDIAPCGGIGYISAFGYSEKYDWLFLPAELNGNSVLPVGDALWNNSSGWCVVTFSGKSIYSSQAGLFSLNLHSNNSSHGSTKNARLEYIPQ